MTYTNGLWPVAVQNRFKISNHVHHKLFKVEILKQDLNKIFEHRADCELETRGVGFTYYISFYNTEYKQVLIKYRHTLFNS